MWHRPSCTAFGGTLDGEATVDEETISVWRISGWLGAVPQEDHPLSGTIRTSAVASTAQGTMRAWANLRFGTRMRAMSISPGR